MRITAVALLLAALFATSLSAQEGTAKRSIKLPSSKALPGSFVAHSTDASGKPATRNLWREDDEALEPGEQLEFENAWALERLKDEHLDVLLAVPYIERLHVDFSSLSAEGVARIATMRGITHLDIRNKFTDQRAACFASWTALVRLQLTMCDITDEGMRHFSANRNLRHLGMQGLDQVTDKALQAFAENRLIEKLDLTLCPNIRGEGIGSWPLREFIAPECKSLTGAGLALAAQSTVLEHINVSGCRGVDDAGVLALKSKAELAIVDVSGCGKLTDRACEGLGTCPKLWFVNLENCGKLGDQTLISLAKLPKLERLFCKGLRLITHSGVAAFKDHKTLQVVQFESGNLGDETAEVLATISTLENLGLEYTSKLTDAGILKLAALKNLRSLDIDNCETITHAGIQTLKDKLPRLVVSCNSDLAESPHPPGK